MNVQRSPDQDESFPPQTLPNGPGAAAILAAGFGALALGAFAFAGDAAPPIRRLFNIWQPAGPLSGVSTASLLVWLVVWHILARRWKASTVDMLWVNVAAFAMLLASLLLTFPPFMDLLQDW
jgi:hypothetical protein